MKIRSKLVAIGLIPTILSCMMIGLVSYTHAKDILEEEQYVTLKVVLDEFSGDVNACKEDDVDITVFEGDTRVKSSIKNVVGTKASEKVIKTVLEKKESLFSTNVDVNGEPYYGYYVPTKDGMLFAGISEKIAHKPLERLSLYIMAVTILACVIFGIAAFVIAIHMGKRINQIATKLQMVASGELNLDFPETSFNGDEIGDIDRATRKVTDELRKILERTTAISSDVTSSSGELDSMSSTTLTAMNEVSKAVEDITIGLQEQSSTVHDLSENLGKINADVDEIKTSAIGIADSSDKLNNSSCLMQEKMSEMAESNERVSGNINDVSRKISEINEVVERVKGIVAVIGDISNQTKMLSLNASIEAARAGEAGKGFAVVADSISSLSKDTQAQVGEITEIIDTLLKDFTECLEKMSVVDRNSILQRESIDGVVTEFSNLAKEISATSEKVSVIQTAIDKSVDEMSSITQEVEELSSIAENSAASTEEVNASTEEVNALMNSVAGIAESLNKESVNLNKSLGFFRV